MKKGFFTSFLALMAAMTLSAQSFTGDIIVNRNGQTNTATVTVTVTQQADGLNTLVLQVPLFGTMTMTDVPAATTGGITTYSAVRDVATNFGAMRTTLFARTVDGIDCLAVAISRCGIRHSRQCTRIYQYMQFRRVCRRRGKRKREKRRHQRKQSARKTRFQNRTGTFDIFHCHPLNASFYSWRYSTVSGKHHQCLEPSFDDILTKRGRDRNIRKYRQG